MRARALILIATFLACALVGASSRAVAQTAPGAPSITQVTATTNTLTVTWRAPTVTGGSAIQAYYVGYIESSVADKADANWTLVDDELSADELSYTVTGLHDGTGYDVRVQAENATGVGNWSTPRTATTPDHANTRTSGTLVTVGTPVLGRLASASDSDYFRIVLTADTDLWAYTTGDVDTATELSLGAQATLEENEDGFIDANPLNFSLRKRVPAETYYLRVYSTTGDTGTYVLHTQAVTDPGNSLATATAIALDSITPGLLAPDTATTRDADFFKLNLTQATDFWMMVVGDGQMRVFFLDSAGTVIRTSHQSTSHSYLLRHTGFNNRILGNRAQVQPAGTYYIKVERFFDFGGFKPYTLIVRGASEPGSTPATAAPLTMLRPESGRISTAAQVEYFSLTLDKETYVGIELLTFAPPEESTGKAPLATVLREGTEVPLFTTTQEQFLERLSYDGYGRLWGKLGAGTYHIKVEAPSSDFPGMYLISAYEDTDYPLVVEKCTGLTTPTSDPWYGCQWHLNNTNQLGAGGGQDINVEEVWATNKGAGVNVAVVDTGLSYTHEDLVDNVDTSRNAHAVTGGDIANPLDAHGTRVAGLIAARDNDIGVRGAAPRATIYAYDLTHEGLFADDAGKAEAMAHERAVTAIYNNSWGSGRSAIPKSVTAVVKLAIREGVESGYGGKGAFYVWGAGNGYLSGDNTNLDELKNYFAVTTACGIGYNDRRAVYSDVGASLWVCAPSGDGSGGTRHMTTTDPGGRYTDEFAGTSAATPIVSGVAALIRAENTSLTWRDVKLILANSARKNDPGHASWQQGARKYGSTTRYSFSHWYGFGAVDAGAAVALARTWTLLPPTMREAEVVSSTINLDIPDAVAGGTPTSVSSSVTFDSYIEFVEFVELNTDWDHAFIRDLKIELISPSGAVSQILPAIDKSRVHEVLHSRYDYQSAFRFGSSRHLGEPAAGEWTLRITDHNPGHDGTLRSWSLRIYGHGVRPAAPTSVSASQSGTTVTVNWTAPDETGASNITGYDLRYIRSDATDGVLTERTRFATSDASPFALTGLMEDVQYDLQVRAVNSEGAGPWSDTVIAVKPNVAPAAPASTAVSAGHERLHVGWDRPTTGSALVQRYDVRSIRTDETDKADDKWDVVSPAWSPGGGPLRYTIGNLTNDVSYDVQVRAANATGAGPWFGTTTGTPAIQNQPPSFPSETTTRSVQERPYWPLAVGAPLQATDPEGDPLTYSMASDAGRRFSIRPESGQIWTRLGLDRQIATSHTVTVSVRDRKDGNGDRDAAGIDDQITVTISVTPPVPALMVTGLDRVTKPERTTTTVATYAASDPDGTETAFTWSLGNVDADDFTIDSSGQLSFRTTPDRQRPTDQNKNNRYLVDVRATAGEKTGTLRVLVTVIFLDLPPIVQGPTTIDFPENGDGTVATFSYIEPNGGAALWSVGGPDGSAFNIPLLGSGTLTFKTPPDHEAKDEYQIVIEAWDGLNTGTREAVVNITDVDEAPTIAGPSHVTLSEGGPTFVGAYSATDPDGDDTSWLALQGADASRFELSEAGVLSFREAPDLSARPDANNDSKYEVNLRASDGDLTGTYKVIVTIGEVNEAPVISGPATVDYTENGTGTIATYTATDAENQTIIWSLGGADAALFDITGGALTFTSSPDYEDAKDSGGDNAYNVTVNASDGDSTATHDVTVTVTNVEETGKLTLPEQPQVGTSLSATLTDPDTIQTTTWKWERSTNRSTWTVIATATTSSYTPAAGDLNHYLRVTAAYTDGHGSGKSLARTSSNAVKAAPVSNTAPDFADLSTTREIAENSPHRATVGRPVTASDADSGDRLTYAISGSDLFTIDGADGQIRVAEDADLNHEGVTPHEVTVTAKDPSEASDSIDVTISVTNVNEAPEADRDDATTDEDTPVTISVLDNDSDPDSGGLTVTAVGAGPQRHGTAVIGPNRQTITYTPDRNYHGAATFTYTISDGRLTDTDTVAVTVRSINDAPDFGVTALTRLVSEAAMPGDNVGAAVTAVDPDHPALVYRLTGAPDFEIDPNSGQVTVGTGVALNREDTPAYTGTVTATDDLGANSSIPLTITVVDVNEPPVAGTDMATTKEDTPVAIDVLANDADPEDRPLRVGLGSLAPRHGSVRVLADKMILYTPEADSHNDDSFTYTISDGRFRVEGLVSVEVTSVNDWPAFGAATATLTVPESTEPGNAVGLPVTATDRDDDAVSYGLAGTDADTFDIGVKSGQIVLASGTRLDRSVQSSYEVTVTADDGNGGRASIDVTINVTAGTGVPVRIIFPGSGGGGGGGPSGPSPSDVDYEWTVKHDLEELKADHDKPTGMWSDGTALWLLENGDGADDAIYAYDLKSGERLEDIEFALDETNRAPRGVWSNRRAMADGATVWIADSGRDKLFAHDLATGERLPDRDIMLSRENRDPRGIWSDGVTMWVLDGRADALFGYDLESGELLAVYALNDANGDPHGVWSDGVTVWVSDPGSSPRRLFAYRLPTRNEAEAAGEDASLERVRDEDFTHLSSSSNNSPRGIWSDGDVMYVADQSDDKVYSYNMPDAIDARLASLTLSGLDIGEFAPNIATYESIPRDAVTQTTVAAQASQPRTTIAVTPGDADEETSGHQVSLAGTREITVTVTSADGSREKTYRVTLEPTVTELALSPTWTSFEWPGDDGIPVADALREGGLSNRVLVIYEWDEAAGSWKGFFPGLEDVPGLNTLATFQQGSSYWIVVTEAVTWFLPTVPRR